MKPLGHFYPGLPYVLIFLFFSPVLFSCDDDDESIQIPEVTAINPTSALPNTTISITGKAFSSVFSDNKVMFKGKEALVLNASANSFECCSTDRSTDRHCKRYGKWQGCNESTNVYRPVFSP